MKFKFCSFRIIVTKYDITFATTWDFDKTFFIEFYKKIRACIVAW